MQPRRVPKIIHPYSLTTAEILYRMPDHPHLLQSFVWQTLDIAPNFPSIVKFLAHWEREIEAAIHSVKVASKALARPAEFRRVDSVWTLH